MTERTAENCIASSVLDKLIAAHDGDVALLWLYCQRHGALDEERAAQALLAQARARWQRLASAPCLQRPEAALEQRRSALDRLEQALEYAARQELGAARQRLTAQAAALEALSPLATLARGYSLVWDSRGELVQSSADCQPGDELQVRLAKGTLDVTVVAAR